MQDYFADGDGEIYSVHLQSEAIIRNERERERERGREEECA